MNHNAPDQHLHNTITVVQGDYAVSNDPNAIMSTVLGSCVAVCLFDPQTGVGGMNHFLLAGSAGASNSLDLKYGINAMELLINRVQCGGGARHHLQAKLFGGARMTGNSRDIGQSNAKFALEFLEREGIPCVSQSLGGEKARRVQFWPVTGAARQMQVSGQAPVAAPVRPLPPPVAEITLF